MTHRGAHPDGVLVQALCRCSATQRWAASAVTGSVMVTSAAGGPLTQAASLPASALYTKQAEVFDEVWPLIRWAGGCWECRHWASVGRVVRCHAQPAAMRVLDVLC